jgi:predicted nucleic acid-binding protein
LERAFLDANVLFSASWAARSKLLRLWKLEDVEVVTSAYAAEEARRNLEPGERRARLEALLARTRVVPESGSREIPAGLRLRDKDRPIFAAAVACGATHLVTGDWRDFGPFFGRRVAGVLILPPSEFLAAHEA